MNPEYAEMVGFKSRYRFANMSFRSIAVFVKVFSVQNFTGYIHMGGDPFEFTMSLRCLMP